MNFVQLAPFEKKLFGSPADWFLSFSLLSQEVFSTIGPFFSTLLTVSISFETDFFMLL
jgi:hypothetical protein